MVGKLKIYLVINKPGFSEWGDAAPDHKRVCVAEKFLLREDCEKYLEDFKEMNRFYKHELHAIWTAVECIS